MRIASIGVSAICAMLAACGGPETSQANNAQANISRDAVTDVNASANASNAMVMLAVTPVPRNQALAIMHERHEGMEKLGDAAKAAFRQFKGSSPDVNVIRTAAKTMNNFAPKVAHLFPVGTGPEVGKTGAKPAIWQNEADFAAKSQDFQKAAQAFAAAANGNDMAAMKGRFFATMQTCQSCHDKYRTEMHH